MLDEIIAKHTHKEWTKKSGHRRIKNFCRENMILTNENVPWQSGLNLLITGDPDYSVVQPSK